MSSSTFLHLRLLFSIFLMPVFFFALALLENQNWLLILQVFLIWHFLVYPSSNGYNSYYDKDEGSIGGLEKPPPVSKELWNVSIALEIAAIIWAFFLGFYFGIFVFLYGLASKAYSYEGVRLKKYPFLSWVIVGFFQGFVILVASYQVISQENIMAVFTNVKVLSAGFLSSLMLWGSYPMTQIYQHKEDARRGDLTLSRRLGIMGTFTFTAIAFGIASGGYFIYFIYFFHWYYALFFVLILSPVLVYFFTWWWKSWKDQNQINFRATMRLNWISAFSLNIFFISIFIINFS